MGCVSLPFRRLPHQPKLFLRFLDDFPAERRAKVTAVLRDINASLGSGDATRRNLDRLGNGAVAVVSGQQVGLFGGPAYSNYKALTAVHVARELTECGENAVPVF